MLYTIFYFFLSISCVFAADDIWSYKKEATPHQTIERKIVKTAMPESDAPPPAPLIQEAPQNPDFIAVPVLRSDLPMKSIITADDLIMLDVPTGQLDERTIMDQKQLIGKEIRRRFAKNKPIRSDFIGEPVVIKRNQDVDLIFQKNGMIINTLGRALSQGGIGERIKVMNLESKKVITGKITAAGVVDVTL